MNIVIFTAVKNRCILYRRVFVLQSINVKTVIRNIFLNLSSKGVALTEHRLILTEIFLKGFMVLYVFTKFKIIFFTRRLIVQTKEVYIIKNEKTGSHYANTPMILRPRWTPLLYNKTGVYRGIH